MAKGFPMPDPLKACRERKKSGRRPDDYRQRLRRRFNADTGRPQRKRRHPATPHRGSPADCRQPLGLPPGDSSLLNNPQVHSPMPDEEGCFPLLFHAHEALLLAFRIGDHDLRIAVAGELREKAAVVFHWVPLKPQRKQFIHIRRDTIKLLNGQHDV